MKKLLISGGCGFLGTNIAIAAREKGYEVGVMDNFVRKGSDRNAKILKDKYNCQVIHGEVRIENDWKDLPTVDAVIHLAGQPGIPKSLENPKLDFHVNAVGTLNALEYARERGAMLIYASTNKIYSDAINEIPLQEEVRRYNFYSIPGHKSNELKGWSVNNGIAEEFPMDSAGKHPHSPYGVSKAAGDLLTQEYFHAFDVPTVVFRMSCIYGLYQNGVSEQGWTDYFVRQRILGDSKLTFYGNGKQVRDCLFGSDAANAYLVALEQMNKLKGGVFNLGGGKYNSSLIEWVNILNRYTDREPMQISNQNWRLADHRVYISDTTKFEKASGWHAQVGIEEGISQMVNAYTSNFYEKQL